MSSSAAFIIGLVVGGFFGAVGILVALERTYRQQNLSQEWRDESQKHHDAHTQRVQGYRR